MAVYKSSEYVNDSESDSDAENIEFQPPKHFNKFIPSTKFSFKGDKEVWLIKTPKGFPLKNLKTLPISFTATSINDGASTFNVDNTSFQVNEELFSTETENRKYSIISCDNKKTYEVFNKNVDRFYNIREVVDIPSINFDKVIKQRKNVKKIKNLRMRHFPTGYGADDFIEADPKYASSEEVNKGGEQDEDSEEEEEEKERSVTKDDDDKVIKKAKIDELSKKEKKDKKEKKEKKEKKDKKDKKSKKEKKDKKDKNH